MISSIKIIVELFAYLYCLAALFGKKFKISIYAVILILLDLFVLTGIREYGFPGYLRLLVYMGMFIYGLVYYNENVKITLINSFLATMIVTVLQLILCFPLYYMLIIGYKHIEVYELLINVFALILLIVGGQRIPLKNVSYFFHRRNKLIVLIVMILFVGLGMNLYKIMKTGLFLGEQYVQLIYCLLLFGFTIFEWQKSRMDAEKKKTQLEMNKLYYDAYEQLIMLVRDRQHDMKNHINAIISMIHTTNNYEELVAKQQEYCGYVMEQNEKTRLLLSSGNPLVTGFLYSKIQEAEEKGIVIEYDLGIKKDIIVPEYELVEMLGILFDNAIEALEKTEELNKQIYVLIKENESELKLIVANTSVKYDDEVIGKFFERGYSNKGENRGIGLSKLKRMVHKQHGDIAVSNELHQEYNYLTFAVRIPNITK